MFPGKTNSAFVKGPANRIVQGDILRDFGVPIVEPSEDGQEATVKRRTLPYAVVVSQDCDLDRDYENRKDGLTKNHDKYLMYILLCQAYLPEEFRLGTHLGKIDMRMETYKSDRFGPIKKNQVERYHFLPGDPMCQVPDLVMDFKHYLSIQNEIVYGQLSTCYLATLKQLFREDLSARFAHYLCRIGLPKVCPENDNGNRANDESEEFDKDVP
jgi:hypothetical protein